MDATLSDGESDRPASPPGKTAVATAPTASLVEELVSASSSDLRPGPHDEGEDGWGPHVTVAEERDVRSRQLELVTELLGRVSRRCTVRDDGGGDFLRSAAPSAGRDGPTFRDALDGLPSSSASGLVSALAGLVGHRTELSDLLPATQDGTANEEAMGLPFPDMQGGGAARCAMTLNRLSLTSGRLYATLLGTRGAWGSGAVDAGAVSSLSSLVRRWGVEVRGREGAVAGMKQKAGKGTKKGSVKGGRPPARKRCKPGEADGADTGGADEAGGVKSRKSVRISTIVSVMDVDDDGDASDEGEEENEDEGVNPMDVTFSQPSPSALTERELVTEGLLLASALGGAASRPDFRNWSADARESYLECLACAHGIVSALQSGGKGLEADVEGMCRDAVSSLEGAMRAAVLPPDGGAEDEAAPAEGRRRAKRRSGSRRSGAGREDAERQRLRETTVQLLRGLLPLLELGTELPHGQAGRVAAHESASSFLVGIAGSISEEAALNSASRGRPSDAAPGVDFDNGRTPGRRKGRRSSLGGGRRSISFAHTPGNRSRRDSAPGGVGGEFVPPSLKKTPRRSGRLSSLSSGSAPDACHPVLTVLIGLLHRLLTGRGLERADARSRASDLAMACLAVLPPGERAGLVRFATDMTESKVSSHRLLGVEVLGRVLREGWYWRDREGDGDGVRGSGGGWAATPSAGSREPAADGSVDNSPAPSLAPLNALRGRLSDVNGTVRARAAMSLGEVVRRATSARDENVNLDGTVIAAGSPPGSAGGGRGGEGTMQTRALTEALCASGPGLVVALRDRAGKDASANVRKCSIVAWLGFLTLANREGGAGAVVGGGEDGEGGGGGFAVGGQDISTLCQLCNDPSVATRKAAADAMTSLVQANYNSDGHTPQASSLELAWAHTVLPLVGDAESTCVTKATEFFSRLVIEPIVELGHDAADKLGDPDGCARYRAAWRILSRLGGGSGGAGGSRSASGSLATALRRLLVDAGGDARALARNLLRAVYHCGSISLGLDRRSSMDSTMSHDESLENDLFDLNTSSMRSGVWCLLDALSSCLMVTSGGKPSTISLAQAVSSSQIDAAFLTLSLDKIRSLLTSDDDVPSERMLELGSTARDCLKVISKMGSFVPIDEARSCFENLLDDLKAFSVSIELVSSGIGALIALTKRQCEEEDSTRGVKEEVADWARDYLSSCERAIETCVTSFAQQGVMSQENEKLMSRVLFSVGELVMVGFSSQEDSSKTGKDDVESTDSHPVRGLAIRPTARLVHLVKLMLPRRLPVPNASSHADPTPTPSAVRAHGYIALGKLSLRDESLAKESLNILARELHHDSNADPAVMSNALMIMGDLCVRYTNLVDKYLPYLAGCLQAGDGKPDRVSGASVSRLSLTFCRQAANPYSIVKKNAVLLLASLLLQDYIKWRGLFIHRFLAAVADPDDEVSCLASTALRGPLLEKQPALFSNHFVGAVFVFNSCSAHPLYQAEASSGGGMSIGFNTSLSGEVGALRRKEIYDFMLSNMNDERKLAVTARLCKEVLGGALETSGDLSVVCNLPACGAQSTKSSLPTCRIVAATNVLTDTLAILTSSQIKVGRKGSNGADDLANTSSLRSEQRSAHKQKLLSKISRKHLMEIVLPILCNLKSVLESSHSPLLKDLMQYLGYVFRSYRKEVVESLANDPTTLQELEYDLKQWKKKYSTVQVEIVAADED